MIINNNKVLTYTIPANLTGRMAKILMEALLYTDSACPDDKPKCGLVQLLYLDDSRTKEQAYRGGSRSGNEWEREHVWPASRGLKYKNKKRNGYTDLHHLRPADGNLNRIRSNFGYNEGGAIVKDKRADGTMVRTQARKRRAWSAGRRRLSCCSGGAAGLA